MAVPSEVEPSLGLGPRLAALAHLAKGPRPRMTFIDRFTVEPVLAFQLPPPVQTAGVKDTLGNGRLHGTARFADMGAVGKPALPDQVGHVRKHRFDPVRRIGQLQLATFVNEAGLQALGGNNFLETAASGQATIASPGEPGFGTLTQGFVEQSNVNPVSEITALITAQRAYEMNSRVVKTADEMLSTTSQLR